MEVLGCTMPPWFERAIYEPTSTLSAIVWRNTSTPRTSAIISSVSRSRSGCTRATWSLETITLPRAERRSSILCLNCQFLSLSWPTLMQKVGSVPVFLLHRVMSCVNVGVLGLLCLLVLRGLFGFCAATYQHFLLPKISSTLLLRYRMV